MKLSESFLQEVFTTATTTAPSSWPTFPCRTRVPTLCSSAELEKESCTAESREGKLTCIYIYMYVCIYLFIHLFIYSQQDASGT